MVLNYDEVLRRKRKELQMSVHKFLMPKKAPLTVHVNKHIIRANDKNGMHDPPITVRRGHGKVIHRCHEIEFHGVSEMVYRPDKPMPCGAQLWAETHYAILCKGG